mgnify:CR=1 FL=1
MTSRSKRLASGKASAPAGYSGTPLVKKLGIRGGDRVVLLNDADGSIRQAIGELPDGARFENSLAHGPIHVIVLAAKNTVAFTAGLEKCCAAMGPDACLWVCWYKKSSGVETDLSENPVRAAGLAAGLVDIKVCAVTDLWSGLKFVVPVKSRTSWQK